MCEKGSGDILFPPNASPLHCRHHNKPDEGRRTEGDGISGGGEGRKVRVHEAGQ